MKKITGTVIKAKNAQRYYRLDNEHKNGNCIFADLIPIKRSEYVSHPRFERAVPEWLGEYDRILLVDILPA